MGKFDAFRLIWRFENFVDMHGEFAGIRQIKNSRGKLFPLCLFNNGNRTTSASLYSRIDDWDVERVIANKKTLYVGLLRYSKIRYTVFDEDSWDGWKPVDLDLNNEDSIMEWPDLEDLEVEKKELSTSWMLTDFLKECDVLEVSRDYYPRFKKDLPVFRFEKASKSAITVFIRREHIRLQDIMLYQDYFKISLDTDNRFVLNDWECPDKYDDILYNRQLKEAEEKRKREREEASDRRRRTFLYDFSGDDSSLNPAFW